MLNYLAIRNWAEPWDDFFHNYYLYRNAAGRWSLVPWDLDREFGENFGWNARKSFFIGEQGDPDGRNGEWNRIKDAFIRCLPPRAAGPAGLPGHRRPGQRRSRQGRAVAPSASEPAIGRRRGQVRRRRLEHLAGHEPVQFRAERTSLQQFGDERHSALADQIACASRSCGLKGEYFNARNFNANDLQLTRTDRVVHFDWGTAAPATGHAHRQLPDPLDRHRHPGAQRELPVLYPVG